MVIARCVSQLTLLFEETCCGHPGYTVVREYWDPLTWSYDVTRERGLGNMRNYLRASKG